MSSPCLTISHYISRTLPRFNRMHYSDILAWQIAQVDVQRSVYNAHPPRLNSFSIPCSTSVHSLHSSPPIHSFDSSPFGFLVAGRHIRLLITFIHSFIHSHQPKPTLPTQLTSPHDNPTMKLLTLTPLLPLLSLPLTHAHATVQAVWINDVDQGISTFWTTPASSNYIRSPPHNDPVLDVTSSSMTCNVANNPAARTLQVSPGDKITFEWHHESRDNPNDLIIDPSHKGPVMVYMAPTAAGSAGDGWVKLAHDGLSDGQWAVERLRANGGKHSITVPDVVPGEYLLRPEIIALHEALWEGGAQFYMDCVQIQVGGQGTKQLPAGVAIPGVYKATDPGVLFDLWSPYSSYSIPGPAVWDEVSGGEGGNVGGGNGSESGGAGQSETATTLQTLIRTTTTQSAIVATPTGGNGVGNGSPGGGHAAKASEWQQCGGVNFRGPKRCQRGLTCKKLNPYYSQCLKN